MNSTHNPQSHIPFGMATITNPAYLSAGQFLYSQYPGIWKMKISRWDAYGKPGAFIKLETSGEVRRKVRARGYSLANAVGNLIAKIKLDATLRSASDGRKILRRHLLQRLRKREFLRLKVWTN